MAYVPVKVDDLRVGHYIKLAHSWTEHPFVLNVFKIQSAKEIAIIRKHGLDKIFYNSEKSDPEALQQEGPLESQTGSKEEEASLAHEIAQEEEALKKEKEARIKVLRKRHDNINKTKRIYNDVLKQGKSMIKNVSAGDEDGLKVADKIIGDIIDVLNGGAASTSVVSQLDENDLSENISFKHALNTCILSMNVGKEFDLSRENLHMLGLGALFHDVGMQKVPARIRYKAGTLTRAERSFMKMHCQYGKEMVEKTSNFSDPSVKVISQHHERLDGSGYPEGLSADTISFFSKIVMVVNEYDYLTNSSKPKDNLTPTQALGHLYKNMQSQFSSEVVVALIQTLTVYPPGTLVELSGGSIGMVISINHQDRMKPVVMVHDPEVSAEDSIIVDLIQDKDFSIRYSLLPKKVSREVLKCLNPSHMNNYFLSKRNMS